MIKLTLNDYDNTNGDAATIYNPYASSEIAIFNALDVNVTSTLASAGILISEGQPDPGDSSYVATLFGDDFVQVALVAMDIPIPVDEAGRLG